MTKYRSLHRKWTTPQSKLQGGKYLKNYFNVIFWQLEIFNFTFWIASRQIRKIISITQSSNLFLISTRRFTNFFAEQKVPNFFLCRFTFVVKIAHFSEWTVFIWAAILAIQTTRHAPEMYFLCYIFCVLHLLRLDL